MRRKQMYFNSRLSKLIAGMISAAMFTVSLPVTACMAGELPARTFDNKTDFYSFLNSKKYFKPQGSSTNDYEISDTDFQQLLNYAYSDSEKTYLKEKKHKLWTGSCYGMSLSSIIIKNNLANIKYYDKNANNTGDSFISPNTRGDKDVSPLESMINYYYLSQYLDEVEKVDAGIRDIAYESENLQRILYKLNEYGSVGLGLFYIEGDRINGGHEVVAYDLKQYEGGVWDFKVYDCGMGNSDDKIFTVTVVQLEDGVFYKECDAWTKAGDYGNILLSDAISAQELADIIPPPSRKVFSNGSEIRINDVKKQDDKKTDIIYTNYENFEITNGIDTVKITNGMPESNNPFDMIAIADKTSPRADAPSEYKFIISSPNEDEEYLLTASGNNLDYYTTEIVGDTGIYARAESDIEGTCCFGGNQYFYTEYPEAASQEIVYSDDYTKNLNWYATTISGNSADILVYGEGDGIHVSSNEVADFTYLLEKDFASVELSDIKPLIPEGTKEISLVGGEDDMVELYIGDSDTPVEDVWYIGYSVVFDTDNLSDAIEVAFAEIEDDYKIRAPKQPQAEGYKFTGWYADPECTKLWNFEKDAVKEDMVLYAGWMENGKAEATPGARPSDVSMPDKNTPVNETPVYVENKNPELIKKLFANKADGSRYYAGISDNVLTVKGEKKGTAKISYDDIKGLSQNAVVTVFVKQKIDLSHTFDAPVKAGNITVSKKGIMKAKSAGTQILDLGNGVKVRVNVIDGCISNKSKYTVTTDSFKIKLGLPLTVKDTGLSIKGKGAKDITYTFTDSGECELSGLMAVKGKVKLTYSVNNKNYNFTINRKQ